MGLVIQFLPIGFVFLLVVLSSEKTAIIDPFNNSNIYSFPLLTSLKLWFFNRISKAEYDVNSEKLYILDLLKGSISVLGIQHENRIL